MPVHEQGFECLDLPFVGVSASFTDKLLYDKPVRSRGTDGLSPWCGAGNYSRSFSKEGSELLGKAKCIPSAACRVPPTPCVCVAPLTEEGHRGCFSMVMPGDLGWLFLGLGKVNTS